MCVCPQGDAAVLRGHETVFHGVGDAHADSEADDARRAFERVGGAHAGLELVGRRRVALERQQTRGQRLRLGFGLRPKELEQRDVAEIGIIRGSASACETGSSSSSTPTE